MSGSLDDRYQILKELARGGMGRVLLARDRILRREVAIKTLLRTDRQARARFLEEAQLTGQLTHPHVVPVHELGEHEDEPFLVMKRVAGETFQELLDQLRAGERTEEYPLRRRLRLLLKACEAIAFAHEQGVIHRDLKPSNLMFGGEEEVLVMDWGLARPLGDGSSQRGPCSSVRAPSDPDLGASGALGTPGDTVAEEDEGSSTAARSGSSGLTRAGAVLGTPAYMPPEQAESARDVDRRADVFALGSVLYELTTLTPTYSGKNKEILAQLRAGPPPRPSALGGDVPPALEAMILKATARDPTDRYPDAGALAADLGRFLDGKLVRAYEESPLEALLRQLRRYRTALVTAAVLSLLLVGAGLLAARQIMLAKATAERAASSARRSGESAIAEKRNNERLATQVAATSSALRLITEAARIGDGFAEAMDALPAGDDPLAGLRRKRDQAQSRLGELRQRLSQLSLGPEQARLESGLDAAGTRFDRDYADALLGRDPALLLRDAAQLQLGSDAPKFAARAYLRLGDLPAAEAKLLAWRPPQGRGQALKQALLAVVRDIPRRQQRDLLDAAIEAAPGRHWLHLWRGIARARLGDRPGAERDLELAAQLQPLDAWIYGEGYLSLLPRGAAKEGIDRLRFLSAQLAPSSDLQQQVNVFERGYLHQRPNVVDDIDRELETWQRTHPRRARAAAISAFLHRHELARAEALAEELAELDADHRQVLRARCIAPLRRGELDRSAERLVPALERYPDDAYLLWVEGVLALERGEVARGVELLERSAGCWRHAEHWRDLARACLASERPADWARGVEAARNAQSLTVMASIYDLVWPPQGDPRNHRLLGKLRRKQGKLVEASLHFSRAHQLAIQSPQVRRLLGRSDEDLFGLVEAHEAMGLKAEAAALLEANLRGLREEDREQAQAILTRLRAN